MFSTYTDLYTSSAHLGLVVSFYAISACFVYICIYVIYNIFPSHGIPSCHIMIFGQLRECNSVPLLTAVPMLIKLIGDIFIPNISLNVDYFTICANHQMSDRNAKILQQKRIRKDHKSLSQRVRNRLLLTPSLKLHHGWFLFVFVNVSDLLLLTFPVCYLFSLYCDICMYTSSNRCSGVST